LGASPPVQTGIDIFSSPSSPVRYLLRVLPFKTEARLARCVLNYRLLLGSALLNCDFRACTLLAATGVVLVSAFLHDNNELDNQLARDSILLRWDYGVNRWPSGQGAIGDCARLGVVVGEGN